MIVWLVAFVELALLIILVHLNTSYVILLGFQI